MLDNNKIITTTTANIKDNAVEIKSEASTIESIVSSPIKEQIRPNICDIIEYADNIIINTEQIGKSNNEINKQLHKAIEEKDKAITEKNSQINKILTRLITTSIIGVAVFAVLFFLHGSKIGLTGSAVCGVVLILSLFIKTYMTYILIATGVVGLVLIALIVYQVVIRGKGLEEIVESVEKVKEALPEQRETIKTTLKQYQDKSTENLVDKVKN